ncbi:hypothetical protein ACWCPF_25785 [Streptomyces sp. NPDC001858]
MARMWTTGFELQSTSLEFGVNSGAVVTGSPSISTSVHRAGTASLRSNPTAATAFIEHQLTTGVVMRTMHRLYLRVDTLPDTATNVYGIGQNGYFPGLLRLQTDGTLVLRDGFTETTLTGTSTALTTGVWHRIELDYTDVDNGGVIASGISAFKGYLNGTLFADTLCSNITGFSRIRMGVQLAATTDLYIDDVAVNDTTGTAQTGLPGAGNVVHLKPNAAGDNNGFATVVGGTAGAANNYTRVSETTPDDATSYNATTATGTTTIDDFNVDSTSSAGIGASDTITLVQVGGRVGSNAATAASIVYRIKGQASGTVSESASVSVAVSGWSTHKVGSPFPYQLTAYTNPQTSTAWTPSTLDTAQIGYRGNVSQSTARRVSTLWVLVEYVPASAVEGGGSLAATATGSATGTVAVSGTTALAATATGSATGDRQAIASGTLAGVAGLSGTAVRATGSTAALAGTATAAADAVVDAAGTAALSATATPTSAGSIGRAIAGDLNATAAADSTALRDAAATGALDAVAAGTADAAISTEGTAGLAAEATATSTAFTGHVSSGQLDAIATATGEGLRAATGSAVLAGTATADASATLQARSGSALAATATPAADGTVTGNGEVTAGLTVTAEIAADSRLDLVAAGELAAAAALAAAGTRDARSTAALPASGTLAATGRIDTASGSDLAATAVAAAAGTVDVRAGGSLAVTATASTAASLNRLLAAALAAHAGITATAGGDEGANVTLTVGPPTSRWSAVVQERRRTATVLPPRWEASEPCS